MRISDWSSDVCSSDLVARDERTGDDGYDPYFVDRIPMFVREPWLEMPARFDAHDRTSLGLAPTVLSLLGIDRARNSFVGQSILRPYHSGDPALSIAPLGPSDRKRVAWGNSESGRVALGGISINK